FRKQTFSRSRTLIAGVVGALTFGFTASTADSGSSPVPGSTPGTRVSFGFSASLGGVSLNGILTGAAPALGGAGGGVGTGGPLEAGTLSEAGAPAPFGGSLNGILVGPGFDDPVGPATGGLFGGV